ncbi:hypothetical protein [Micromonospora sp. NBC_01412]
MFTDKAVTIAIACDGGDLVDIEPCAQQSLDVDVEDRAGPFRVLHLR